MHSSGMFPAAKQPEPKSVSASGLRALVEWAMRPPGSGLERVSYLVFFALLVAARLPRVLLEGRFWAEEGRVFFENAWNLPWLDALLFPYAGYLNLTANAAGLLARHLAPLWAAPYVSTGLALLIQCLPAIIILTSRADWLRHRAVLAAALMLIATPPHADEVWLNSICSQYHLTLAAAMILALKPRGGLAGVLHALLLLLATLSAPMSWLLAPLFVLRALLERCGPRTMQTLAVVAGVAIQLIWFYGPAPNREIGIDPALLGGIVLVKNIVIPLIPTPLDAKLIHLLAPKFSLGEGPLWPLAVVALLFLVLAWGALRHPRRAPLWFLLAGGIVATGAYAGSLGNKADLLGVLGGSRYPFGPQVLFGLTVLGLAMVLRGKARVCARVVVIWLLVVGLWGYWSPAGMGPVQDGPSWLPEVQKYQQDHHYRLKIWPPGWSMGLPPK